MMYGAYVYDSTICRCRMCLTIFLVTENIIDFLMAWTEIQYFKDLERI